MPATSSSNAPQTSAALTRTLQIIIGAMIIGLIGFLAIILVIPGQASSPIETYIYVGLSIFAVVSSFLLPALIVATGRKRISKSMQTNNAQSSQIKDDQTAQLLKLLFTKTIIGAALIEGPAFFSILTYMKERQVIALIAAIAQIVILTLKIPTRTRVDQWLAEQSRMIDLFGGL